ASARVLLRLMDTVFRKRTRDEGLLPNAQVKNKIPSALIYQGVNEIDVEADLPSPSGRGQGEGLSICRDLRPSPAALYSGFARGGSRCGAATFPKGGVNPADAPPACDFL